MKIKGRPIDFDRTDYLQTIDCSAEELARQLTKEEYLNFCDTFAHQNGWVWDKPKPTCEPTLCDSCHKQAYGEPKPERIELLEVIWKQISRYTMTAHQHDDPTNEHIYSICGIIDKKKLEDEIINHLTRGKG